ncbi:rod shape-determining protein RodA [Romboutsia lituseburensis]|uniref:Rod shape determining protein RodA n=1 Tax=Romboutsia lituseburensis DSM 797 TaxID=1121325 RepID=A0A1G9NUD0_9FIRM|nr:rod shape-determining protein RodA [Romboutsia lituseburensis]CEH33116.1 Lipid II flippase FtsW [Romboutsia lituseburensis]SDL89974.1 rod shape determining protein RodA [Romboutsia lituseburensis DSM 797]
MIEYKSTIKLIKQLDWKLIITVLAIFGFGLVVLSSATHAQITGNYWQIYKQGSAFGLGVLMIIGILLFDYNFLGKYYKALYIVSLLLLAVILIPGIGAERGGARSWLNLGPLDFQTSELVKLTFILSYAKIVESKKGKLNNLKEIMPVVIYAVPFIGLLFAQPDLGTAIVFSCIIAGMLFTAGLDIKLIKRCIVAVLVTLPLMYLVMAPHQKERIDAFLHPDDPTKKGNYQVMQSMIAIGSGGVTGKGLYNGTQNQEGFLPVQESDFIFAVIGEELGVVGMAAVIGLYALFLTRMIYIAKEAKDFYGTLIVVGVMSMFAYQIIQNIGMTVALIPVTGVTLPFISYGGSSLLTSLANLGLVLNVCMRRKKINF